MNFKKTKNIKQILYSFFLMSIFASVNLQAQHNTEANFDTDLKEILTSKPTLYKSIHSVFKSYTRDSLKLKQLAETSKNASYVEGESYALNALGVLYRNISLYKKSISTHETAKVLAQKANNLELQIINLNNIGVAYRRMDLVKPALDFHTKALDIARSVKNPSNVIKYNIAVSHNSMGNIYLILEQYDLANRQFQESLIIEKASDNKLGLAINYQNIGYAFEAQNKLNEALANYNLSLNYNNQIDSNLGRVICFNSIGQVYIKQKKLHEAKVIIEQALEKALIIGDQYYIALSYINLGWAKKELNLLTAAESNLKQGLHVAQSFSLQSSVVEASKHLSDLYVIKGNYKLALQHYKSSIELKKTISNDRNLRYVNDVIIQYENEAKNNQIEALAIENELVKSKLELNKKMLWGAFFALIIIIAIIIALYRNRQLKQEKQILTLEQDMLRSQMNPHFIFNSLNSIKLYIINNEKENAVYYLNKFSKLIRKILVASTEKETSLEDELETMKLYMNIENIRFSNEIDFEIKIEGSINTANIKVPSLVLQPFLENALWHGLSSKKENDKNITLSVLKTSTDYVTISIEDNGIGRKQSNKINKDKLLKRKSVGIAITKARLANFSKGYTNDYKINIEDLYDNNNKATGTKVIVNIPVL